MGYTDEQIAEIEADSKWWKSLICDDSYHLIGFTYRREAAFGMPNGCGSIEVTTNHLRLLGVEKKDAEIARLTAEVERLKDCVPKTWLDPLLTGPNAVIDGRMQKGGDIERLLIAIRKRMDSAPPTQAQVE